MEDHSIFYSAVRDSSVNCITLPDGLYEKNKKIFLDYINYHKELIADLNTKIKRTTQPIYLFGAHVFAQYLIEMGLKIESIVCLLDNDPQKEGKRLYGTALYVKSPKKELLSLNDPVVILKAGVYNIEIKSDILHNINKSTIFFD